jgi:hypothetical protein
MSTKEVLAQNILHFGYFSPFFSVLFWLKKMWRQNDGIK